jgi:hypothetical protein
MKIRTGNALFVTADGLEAYVTLPRLNPNHPPPFIWHGIAAGGKPQTWAPDEPVPVDDTFIRVYRFFTLGEGGLPVYHEVTEAEEA